MTNTNGQDDQEYRGPEVLAVLSWDPHIQTDDSGSSDSSDENIPLPLKASGVTPSDFDFGPPDGALEISEDESSEIRLRKIAINFVKISQLFGNGKWIPITPQEYRDFCAPRKVLGTERSLFLDHVLRGNFVARGDGYANGPNLPFYLSEFVTGLSDSIAA